MKTKLSLLAFTITISLASCVVSLLAQEADPADLEYRARLIRDAVRPPRPAHHCFHRRRRSNH